MPVGSLSAASRGTGREVRVLARGTGVEARAYSVLRGLPGSSLRPGTEGPGPASREGERGLIVDPLLHTGVSSLLLSVFFSLYLALTASLSLSLFPFHSQRSCPFANGAFVTLSHCADACRAVVPACHAPRRCRRHQDGVSRHAHERTEMSGGARPGAARSTCQARRRRSRRHQVR